MSPTADRPSVDQTRPEPTFDLHPDPTFEPAPGQLFIGGTRRESGTGLRHDVVDPSTGRTVTTIAAANTDDVDAAVAAARTAFDTGTWATRPGRERSRILLDIARLIRERGAELAALESLDVGKPLLLARTIDVTATAEHFEYAAALAQGLDGTVCSTPLPVHAFTRREPLGVIAAITPFNFPLLLSATKIAPALAAGNAIVHKPAGDTSLSALLMAEILQEAGVPDGVLNVVTGSGAQLGDHLVSHPGVDKISFTGSAQVGAHIAHVAGAHLRPVTAELGGNCAHIVFADADLERAVQDITMGFLLNTGQFCMAGARLLVERAVHDEILQALERTVPTVPVGDPRDPATVVGPLAGADRRERVDRLVQETVRSGARVVTGAERLDLNGGFFYRPTVLAEVDCHAPAVREEVFGPVLTVQPFDGEEEAVARANGTAFGLAAGVQTSDLSRAHRLTSRLRAGTVWVNCWGLLDPAVPFGGVKHSGWGREGGTEVLDSCTTTKSVIMSLPGEAGR
ncbi:MAG: hypothetical protein QG608_2583 [Actinomycetota bacterium]|nr:hypothetical protein [Actinomycetota bacterium]